MRRYPYLASMLLMGVWLSPAIVRAGSTGEGVESIPMLSDEEAWRRLPHANHGGGQPLPSWARMLAGSMPRTAAGLLRFDFVHRAHSPLDPKLRAQMRWVAAHANRCDYSEAYALADARRAGLDMEALTRGDDSKMPIATKSRWITRGRSPSPPGRSPTRNSPPWSATMARRMPRRWSWGWRMPTPGSLPPLPWCEVGGRRADPAARRRLRPDPPGKVERRAGTPILAPVRTDRQGSGRRRPRVDERLVRRTEGEPRQAEEPDLSGPRPEAGRGRSEPVPQRPDPTAGT